jgi:hypothetical protein
VLEFLLSQKFCKTHQDPCWLVLGSANGLKAMIMVEVDDSIVATKPSFRDELKGLLGKRFQGGKWEANQAEYAGRSVVVHPSKEKIEIGQEKYIIENMRPMQLAQSRKSDKSSPLSQTEFVEHRSLLYKLNWVAKESRPEAAGTVSILAARLHVATIGDACQSPPSPGNFYFRAMYFILPLPWASWGTHRGSQGFLRGF